MGAVPARFEQRKTYRVFAGQEGAADKAVAVADDPITPAVALDVEVIGRADKCRGKSGHGHHAICFTTPE